MKEIYSEVKCDHNNSEGFWCVDAWRTGDDNEEGKVVAAIHEKSGDVFYCEPEARLSLKVAEVISLKKQEIKAPKSKAGAKAKKKEPKIQVTCYGKPEFFNSIKEAKTFYQYCQENSEGAERDRYTNILIKLRKGLTKVDDADLSFADELTYIDLCLPSGKLWATENVKIGTKSHFSFDEAVKLFGEHLPSKEDWKELFDNCKCKWEKERKRFTVTGPNGNSIFLPAAGYRGGVSVSNVGSGGGYWSSSVADENYAYNVTFYSGSLYPQSYYRRYGGFSVRLVR